MERKICAKCHDEKPINEFYISNSSKDGHQSNCKLCVKEYNILYSKINTVKIKDRQKEYNDKNKKNIKEKHKIYCQINKDILKKKNVARRKIRHQTDNLFRLKHNIRGSIGKSIRNKGYTKKTHTYVILGCSYDEIKSHLEKQFQPWMNWNNYGLYNGTPNYGWDIDHIIPDSSATTEEELLTLNHYTNLQPLCSHINRDIKRNLINW